MVISITKKLVIVVYALCCSTLSTGQTIGSYLISSAGSSIMSPDGAFYLAIGEPMNTELTDGDIMISQGFLQVTIQGSIVNDEDLLEERITVFPNPTINRLNLELEGDPQDYTYQLYDSQGQLIQNKSELSVNAIDVSGLEVGIYLVTLHKEGQSSATFKITKQ